MSANPTVSTTITRHSRLLDMMKSALGGAIGELLDDPAVEEVRVNPDGRLWYAKDGRRICHDHTLDVNTRARVIKIVADHVGEIADKDNPSFPAELPETGYRFHAILPPESPDGPTFVIRKKSNLRLTLDDYVTNGQLTQHQRDIIVKAVHARDNIVIVGGTNTGKTTFANAVLYEMGRITGRVITLEDTLELRVEADEVVRLRTVRNRDQITRSMTHLLRDTLRMTPDRLIVGEVRGPEVMDMLDAWNTGHPGGLCTIHANSANEALERIEDLLVQGGFLPVPRKIARTVQIIVSIGFETIEADGGQKAVRRVREVLRVRGVQQTPEGNVYTLVAAE
ncbi:ATPase, T2SS/T4P/T4SS family [Xanthomonas campestris pv. campestris]|uniref:ATPase, T2SS/T4P/T4SS family n=1 Tax=Xanthomonas campestris TaxID=339 RepID=UPI002368B05F|nr:ATPase, T2SS/T4P/T4SS family [Xanthomonas campestris]MEB2146565.1 ATPase, T2SS/T4P/T4SS family [Xanthomonas campestris pv. campestris]WDK89483.1 Flp pilus assembly complex ATPase component TadA [Xanthomonas campestris pv. campestris]WDK93611.1 Flp pilus assembly complex ATPase component TadA [Xanthomonas campestris pv. campestris]